MGRDDNVFYTNSIYGMYSRITGLLQQRGKINLPGVGAEHGIGIRHSVTNLSRQSMSFAAHLCLGLQLDQENGIMRKKEARNGTTWIYPGYVGCESPDFICDEPGRERPLNIQSIYELAIRMTA